MSTPNTNPPREPGRKAIRTHLGRKRVRARNDHLKDLTRDPQPVPGLPKQR